MNRKTLNINQKLFCQLYFGGGEYFGNGVWCYAIAYKFDLPLIPYNLLDEKQRKDYETCKASSSDLLTIPNIVKYGNELLDELIKDEIVDRELVRVIMQNEELSAKVNAIREYNKLKQRIVDKQDITSKGERIIIIPQELINKNGQKDETSSSTKSNS